MSEVQVEMQLRTSSGQFNTDERTDVTKKLVADVDQLSVVDARRAYDGMTTIGEALEAGWSVTGERHELIRTGEREQIPHHVRSAVWFRDRGRCEMCGTYAQEWELDHIVPWSAGGSDSTTNLRVLCVEHNQSRSNYRTPVDNRPRMGATWWCDRCYGLEAGAWRYDSRNPGGIECPMHGWSWRRCAVSRNYEWAERNPDHEGWTNWHQRDVIVAPSLTAFCAHCDMPGVTDVVL